MQISDPLDKDSREFIVALFRGRCVVCHAEGTDVNEILPRSRGRRSLDWHNKVLLCRKCHRKYHNEGVSKKAIRELQEIRVKYLVETGRAEFA